MSRTQQDSVIDDDEETCPLCIEEFDLSDKNFRPCPCGYQICQFCFNSLKTTYEKSTCPNCRRPYDEKTIQYKPPTTEEYREDLTKKKQAAQKRKEVEKREVETSSRRNLAGVRVKQQNLVYVIGLVPSVKDESTLLQTLRGENFFGQYGEIDKIVVSKAKPGASTQGIGVYVTYAKNDDAALCISMVDGSINGDRVLRAQYGTTKYCSTYLRGEVCNNKSCSFLHESGEDGQNTSLQNEPITGKPATRPQPSSLPQMQPHRPPQVTAQAPSNSQPMRRSGSKDEGGSRKGSTDTSALPSSASWANKDASISRARRESQAASRGSPSPLVAPATLNTSKSESKRKPSVTPSASAPSFAPSVTKTASSQAASSGKSSPRPPKSKDDFLDEMIAIVNSTDLRFRFNEKMFSPEDLAALDRYPSMIDPYGGAKRRLQREKDAAHLAKLEAEAQAKVPSTVQAAAETLEEEDPTSGSLQLGGEPEEHPRSTSQTFDKMTSVIGRPAHQFGGNVGISDQFQNLSINGQDLTPQHRQQLAVLTNASHAPGLGQPQQGFGSLEQGDPRPNPFQTQQSHYEPMHGHARQTSRFSFANDTAKPMVNTRFQQPGGASHQHFYSSGVQGPPPGLKTAGTPPISGGGMFAQGYGFTSNMNSAFGGQKENNEMLMRGRSGTGTNHDVAKREYLLSLQNTHRSPPPHAPAPGPLNSLYGPYTGAYQDPGLVKQKRKGKKHRHANTSSSGGGVVDLADPSILQARIHQAGASGQGPFGGQNQDDKEFPPLAPPPKPQIATKPRTHSTQLPRDSSVRSTTPKVPPGLSLPHGHPSPNFEPSTAAITGASSASTPGVIPVVPLLSDAQRSPALSQDLQERDVSSNAPKVAESTHSEDSSNTEKAYANIQTQAIEPSNEPNPITTRKSRAQSSGSPVEKASKLATNEELSGVRPKKAQAAGKLNIDTSTASVSSTAKNPDSLTSASATRPRTLRLTTVSTPKTESVPMSAATDKSTTFPLAGVKQLHSRQPSVSDVSRASRPATPTASDPLNSTVNSRASSPPPMSLVGGTADKSKSKSQQKKERRAKAKEASEPRLKEEDTKPSAPSPAEEIAPIISHQKKKKKDKPTKTPIPHGTGKASVEKDEAPGKKPIVKEKEFAKDTTPSPATAPSDVKVDAQGEDTVKAAPVKEEPVKPETIASKSPLPTTTIQKMTVKALYETAGSSQDASFSSEVQHYFSHTRVQKILEDMRKSGSVSSQSAFFNPQPLPSYRLPPDQVRQSARLASQSNTIHLTAAHRTALHQGQPVHMTQPSSSDSPAFRVMISPFGTIYRHLTPEEEARALELETMLHTAEDQHGACAKLEFNSFLDSSDPTNSTGDLSYLLNNASQFGITLDPDPTTSSAADDDDNDSPSLPSVTGAFGVPPNPAIRLAAEKAAASLIDGRADAEETQKAIEHLQLSQPMEQVALGMGSTGKPIGTTRMGGSTVTDVEELLARVKRYDAEMLQRKISEYEREVEALRKKVEGEEKGMRGKVREAMKWREGIWGKA